jgi:ribosome-associated toxin RatA of RatAB toxin-antitoxin module
VRRVDITAHVKDGVADDVFELLTDIERYPQSTDAVRQVTIEQRAPNTLVSAWEVNFRNGILKWKEQDHLDRDQRTIRFTQLEGDLAHWTGAWHVDEHPKGCSVRFTAEFDMGMPTLADMLEPIAERTLRDNVTNIIRGLINGPIDILPA